VAVVSSTRSAQLALTAAQRQVFDDLLAVGGARPVTPPALASELLEILEQGTAAAMGRWQENRLWISKSHIAGMLRCEGATLASAGERNEGYSPAVATGVVSHRAIQIAHTHPHLTPSAAVDAAIEVSRDDERFGPWWDGLGAGTQSDLLCQMISRAVGFLDAFPPLAPNWIPRFEESLQVRVGKLVLSARPDLILGRPRPDMRQTMFLCDFKTGGLHDQHHFEAMFYALVTTIRFGVAPYRSTVFSLASGDWTDPTVDAEQMRGTARIVADAVSRYVDVLLERRPPTLTADHWCTWCPARTTCTAHAEARDAAAHPQAHTAEVATPVRRTRKKAEPAAQPAATPARSVYDIE